MPPQVTSNKSLPITKFVEKNKKEAKKPVKNDEGIDDGLFFGFDIDKLRKLKDEAFLGFLSLDVVHPPDGATWGKFNNRSVDHTWVKDLAASFTNLLDNCTNLHAMQVAVDPEWLVDPRAIKRTVDGLKIDQVPVMEFNKKGEGAIKENNLWVLGGNHRRLALAKYIDKMKADQEKMKLAVDEESKAKKDGAIANVDPEKERDLKEVKDMVKSLQAKIDSSPMWAVMVYDRAKIENATRNEPEMAKAVFRLISRNETKGVRRATDEELLQEIIDELKDVFELDLARMKDPSCQEDFEIKYPGFIKKVEKKSDGLKKKAPGYRQICCLPAFALGLVMASRIPSHYTHAPWFKMKTLSEMINVHGTFVSEFIIESVEFLERIANPRKPPLDFATIEKKKIAFGTQKGDLVEIRESLVGMEDAFRNTGDLSSWSSELLDDIDKCFVKNYVGKDGDPAPYLFFPRCPKNLNSFMDYCGEVDQTLHTHSESAPPYAREYFLYYSIWQMRNWPFPVPLGTKSVIGALNMMATNATRGFSEAISWVATSVSWSPLINAKVFVSLDQFDSMIDVVSADPLVRKGQQGVRRKLFSIFFSNLTTYITRLDVHLRNSPIPRHRIPNDLSDFKKLSERADKSSVGVSTSKSKKKRGGTARDKDDSNDAHVKVLSETADHATSDKMSPSEAFITSLGWDVLKYDHEWRSNLTLMALKLKPFPRNHRVAPRMGERLLVMSGLSWNILSHHHGRDWTNVITAITAETALVEYYRSDLLSTCPGICDLRDELRTYLLSIATQHHVMHPTTGDTTMEVEWDFPDQIPSSVGTPDPTPHDPDVIRKDWTAAAAADQVVKAVKARCDGVHATVKDLMQNKLLWSSEPTAAQGSVETLAHNCISALAHIMHFNASRMAHDMSQPGEPFNPKTVIVPFFGPTKHAKSLAFADQLGYKNWVFKFDQREDELGVAVADVPGPSSSKQTTPVVTKTYLESHASYKRTSRRKRLSSSFSEASISTANPFGTGSPLPSDKDEEDSETRTGDNQTGPSSSEANGHGHGLDLDLNLDHDLNLNLNLDHDLDLNLNLDHDLDLNLDLNLNMDDANDVAEPVAERESPFRPLASSSVLELSPAEIEEVAEAEHRAVLQAQCGPARGTPPPPSTSQGGSKRPPPTSPPEDKHPNKRASHTTRNPIHVPSFPSSSQWSTRQSHRKAAAPLAAEKLIILPADTAFDAV